MKENLVVVDDFKFPEKMKVRDFLTTIPIKAILDPKSTIADKYNVWHSNTYIAISKAYKSLTSDSKIMPQYNISFRFTLPRKKNRTGEFDKDISFDCALESASGRLYTICRSRIKDIYSYSNAYISLSSPEILPYQEQALLLLISFCELD